MALLAVNFTICLPWSDTSPWQYCMSQVSWGEELVIDKPSAYGIEKTIGHFETFGRPIGERARQFESALVYAAEILEYVQNLIQTDEAFCRIFRRKFLGGDHILPSLNKILHHMLRPRKFIVERNEYWPEELEQTLARSQMPFSEDDAIWVQFSTDITHHPFGFLPEWTHTIWYDNARGLLMCHSNAYKTGIWDRDRHGLSEFDVRSGQTISYLLSTITPSLIRVFARATCMGSLFPGFQQPPSTPESLRHYPSPIHHVSLTRFIVLSYLQARHPFHDFVTNADSNGPIFLKNLLMIWSPFTQEIFCTADGPAPVELEVGGRAVRAVDYERSLGDTPTVSAEDGINDEEGLHVV